MKRKTFHRPQVRSQALLKRLARVESPNITFMEDDFPIVMKKGRGLQITDEDGNRYRDFTSCFGVLALGHQSVVVRNALRRQAASLIHGMGDVHPSRAKIRCLEILAKLVPFAAPKAVLGLNGADAVEIALKTATLVTKRHRFIAFSGAYHGLSLAPLALTDRTLFRQGFEEWLCNRAAILPFPLVHPRAEAGHAAPTEVLLQLEEQLRSQEFAAVILEPIQGRGGDREFSQEFIRECKGLCQKYGTLLIFDEIFTGFGRTGALFATNYLDITPDLLCVGKAMGGGLPLSACVGECLDAWGKTKGEARHTSTFLGHPLACAVSAEVMLSIQKRLPEFQQELHLIERAWEKFLRNCHTSGVMSRTPFSVTGRGFMRGIWFLNQNPGFAVSLAERLLTRGFITLPSGTQGDVLSLTPPLITKSNDFRRLFTAIHDLLSDTSV